MPKKFIISSFIFISFLLWLSNPAGAATRTALVIGNSNYESAPLRNPANDATDMAVTLESLGFEVIKKINADMKGMTLAIDEFYKRLKKAEIGLFYFAGHGMQIQGTNYLIPTRAHVTSESDVRWQAIPAGQVLGKMYDAGNRFNIVILDACRDNPFKRSFRTGNNGLAQMDAPKGTIIAYATAPGSVAADGEGRNGIYTKHLLSKLKTSGLEVQDIFRETGLGVMKETGDKQVPWTSTTPVPRYYLASSGGGGNGEGRFFEQEQASLQQKPAYSHTTPSTPDVVERDGVYVAYANGIVKDTNTGLEWKAGPDEDITWEEARSWVESLNLDGGGWRMPTMDELAALHKKIYDNYKKIGSSQNMTLFKLELKILGSGVWSRETRDSSQAWISLFGSGGWYPRQNSNNSRAFAVRSRSGG